MCSEVKTKATHFSARDEEGNLSQNELKLAWKYQEDGCNESGWIHVRLKCPCEQIRVCVELGWQVQCVEEDRVTTVSDYKADCAEWATESSYM